MVVTMMLLQESVEAGDKISVFSQSLNTLDFLEVCFCGWFGGGGAAAGILIVGYEPHIHK